MLNIRVMILKTLTLLQEYLDEAFDAAEYSLLSLIKEVKSFLGQYNIVRTCYGYLVLKSGIQAWRCIMLITAVLSRLFSSLSRGNARVCEVIVKRDRGLVRALFDRVELRFSMINSGFLFRIDCCALLEMDRWDDRVVDAWV